MCWSGYLEVRGSGEITFGLLLVSIFGLEQEVWCGVVGCGVV